MNKSQETNIRGVPANAIILPLEMVISVLLAMVIILVFEVNRSSNDLAGLMERSGIYLQEATELQAGANTLSETVSGFAQSPVTEDGSPNVGPLKAYAAELALDRRASQIAERFHGYQVSDDIRGYVDHAAEIANTMMDIQTHVISLLRSVYPLPPIPDLAAIPEVPLTDEELAMPDEGRVGYARQLILNGDYAQMKYFLAQDIANCNHALQQQFSAASDRTKRHVAVLRAALWGVIIAIIIIMLLSFSMLRHWVVRPLKKHTAAIASDENMRQDSAIREMRVLVNAYNGLLNRRNRLEGILRSAAETDALTGLPNRYSMERAALEAGEAGGSMAVLMFDVNYLKQVNDTGGHLAGDRLLCTAGACIRECFANSSNDNCYRLGGDEFAAMLQNCDEADVRERLRRFEKALERENISVSAGYAYASATNEDSFKALLALADKRMYKKKKHDHKAAQR